MANLKLTKTLYVYELTQDPFPNVSSSMHTVIESNKFFTDTNSHIRYSIKDLDKIREKKSSLRLISLNLSPKDATNIFTQNLLNQADVYSHTANILRNHAAILQREV